jgi:hypothetical protein
MAQIARLSLRRSPVAYAVRWIGGAMDAIQYGILSLGLFASAAWLLHEFYRGMPPPTPAIKDLPPPATPRYQRR